MIACCACDQLLDTGHPDHDSVRLGRNACLDSTLHDVAERHPLHVCVVCHEIRWQLNKAVGLAHLHWRNMAEVESDSRLAQSHM